MGVEQPQAMNARPAVLQQFLDAAHKAYADTASGETRACLDRVFGALQAAAPATPSDRDHPPTTALLDGALEPARQAGGNLADLAARIADLDPLLSWRPRGGAAPQASESFPTGHVNAMILGPGGIEERSDLWVGLSLLAPGVRYPDHSHSPEEIYLVLTDGQFQHGDSGWFTPGVGGTFHNTPRIQHAMRAPDTAPLLAVWCLYADS